MQTASTTVPKEESDKVFQVLKAQKANKMCFDCQSSSPTWTSVWYGVYICYNCSSAHRNLGVHISFVRSTNLDTWRTDHLRRMKVGGNATATDFFTKHGGSALLNESDAKKKYTSKAAELYREELNKRVEADTAQFPAGIYVEGATDLVPVTAPAESTNDDFFDSWDKPATPKLSSAPATASSPATLNRTVSSPTNGSRTVTSASLRSTSTASAKPVRLGLGAARLNSASSTGSGATSGGAKKLGGLKATKVVQPIDFEKAKREAEAEEERIRQLGYDRKREEEEAASLRAKAAEERAAAAKVQAKELGGPAKSGLAPAAPAAGSSRLVGQKQGNSQDMARLGMGMRRLGLGSTPATPTTPSASSASANPDEPTYAREHFGTQKAISSDMYFGRGVHDPARSAETQARLQQFQGATAISSAAYFGREEEEERGYGGDGVLGDGSIEGIQTAARDAIARVMANPDVQNGVENLRAGALKLSEYLAQMGDR
ncbi:hypothetical protein M0805_003654 [Coniferiporia weirii]|nr:hypothetical protein M0805_003654 [Coniferiporia weirii]